MKIPVTLTVDLAEAWKPYDRQGRFIASAKMFDLFLGGVGSGKSHALTCWVISRALRNPGATGALLGRTSIDLQTVLLPNLFARLEELQQASGINWIKSYDKGDAILTLINDTRIYFRPYNRIEKLRGLTLTFAGADEIEWSEAEPEEVWSVLSGRLRGKGQYPGLAFATSPNGLRGITKRFVEAQRNYLDCTLRGDIAGARAYGQFSVVTATSFDNPYLPPHFFDSLKSMSKRRYAQEVEGKVLSPTHAVFQLDSRHLAPWDWRANPSLPRVYGVDWGTQDHHVAVFAQVKPDGTWIFCDELICDNMPRGQFQAKLHAWIDSHGSTAPALIGVDRAVPQENQILQARYRATPVRWMDSKEDQQVTSGLEFMRDMLDPIDGDPRIMFAVNGLSQVIAGKTAGILPGIRGYAYGTDASGQPTPRPKKDNTCDHVVDAMRYAIYGSANLAHLHGGRVRGQAPAQPGAGRPSIALTPGRSGRHVT